MPIKYITKWNDHIFDDIIDVRSPNEYNLDHLPNAINLPVLNNEQRLKIGTIYNKENAFKAKKLGAALISENISKYLKKEFADKPGKWKPLIYCWRGGKRSKAIATVLSEIGWLVYVLKGGYKTYRLSINKEILKIVNKNKFIVLKGPTGCAKTKILSFFDKKGLQILDLENIACHKGSLIGKIPNKKQPSQKLFESNLYCKLKKFDNKSPIFIESESSKIGNLYLPQVILKKIKVSPCIEVSASIRQRIIFLIKDYNAYLKLNSSFTDLFEHAKSIVGKEKVKKWKISYKNKNWEKLAFYLISDYYDPLYIHNLKTKKNKILFKFYMDKIDKKNFSMLYNKIKSI